MLGASSSTKQRFGVVAERPITVDEINDYEAIRSEDFERRWREARTCLGDTTGS
jgi:hypothetical protein